MNQPTIYVGASHMRSEHSTIYALDAHTGAEVWRQLLQHTSVSYPVYYETAIYYSTSDGFLCALRANDGSRQWQQQVHHQFPSPPTLASGLAYVCTAGDMVYAFQAADGALRWQQPVRDLVQIRPVATSDRVYVRSKDGSVHALRADDGSFLWRTPGRGETLIMLVATRDIVYLVEPDGGLSALRANDGFPLWHQPTSYSYAGLRDPILSDGILYLIVHDSIHARRVSDGSLVWHVRARGVLSLTAINSRLCVCGGRNTNVEVYALRTGDGSLVWRWRTSFPEGGVTTPVVAYETVYVGIGAADGLYALHVNNGRILWHALSDMGVTTAAAGERMTVESESDV